MTEAHIFGLFSF